MFKEKIRSRPNKTQDFEDCPIKLKNLIFRYGEFRFAEVSSVNDKPVTAITFWDGLTRIVNLDIEEVYRTINEQLMKWKF